MNFRKPVKKLLYAANKNPLSVFIHNNSLSERARMPLTSIVPLSQKISMFAPFTNEIHQPNDWYGHASNLKTYLGLEKNYQFKFILEHGLYLNDQVDNLDVEADLPTIITYSDYRLKILREYRPNMFSIGPFIHYAKSYLTDGEIEKEKKRLGESLLFFPAHSTPVIGFEYDIKKLCRKIKKIAGDRTVRICLYWKDILLGRHKTYQDFGFECVTAGHMLDPLFLPRLKSLISISDLTASNIVSSHVGFCIYMNKPHIVISEELKMKTSRNWNKRINEGFKSEGYVEVLEEFSKLNYKITQKQKNLITKYWGSDRTRTKAELKKIILQTEKLYKEFKSDHILT